MFSPKKLLEPSKSKNNLGNPDQIKQTSTIETFDDLEVHREIQYKKDKIRQNDVPNKFCMIVPSTSVEFATLRTKIMKYVSRNQKCSQMIFRGYDETKKIFYDLIDGKEYEFEFESNKITAITEQVSEDKGLITSIGCIDYLFLRADSIEIIQKFMDHVLIKKTKGKIYQYSTDTKGWNMIRALRKRDPSTLILKDGFIETLMDDLDDFTKSEDDYNKFGIPYKKVYLFHGEPGTGKTSLSNIIADHTNRSLYILNFDPKMTDDELSSAVRRIDSKVGILLLEDIDCLFKSRNTNQNMSSVSFSSLLNILDGAIQNVGLITIITTNHVKLLDSALHRPLRVDKVIKFEKADDYQIRKLFELYEINNLKTRTLDKIITMASSASLCPAGVSGFLFRNRRKQMNDELVIELFKSYIDEFLLEKNSNIPVDMFS